MPHDGCCRCVFDNVKEYQGHVRNAHRCLHSDFQTVRPVNVILFVDGTAWHVISKMQDRLSPFVLYVATNTVN
jgi:hypothetical protein